MCELLGLSSNREISVKFSLSVLAEHGGKTGPHRDGWGIAYYDGSDARVLRDTTCASTSPWAQFVGQQDLPSKRVIAHIRKATHGGVAIRNTQPFAREMGGRTHVFAHNGHLPTLQSEQFSATASFHPIGETDSEVAFCWLLERLKPIWEHAYPGVPPLSRRSAIVTDFAEEIGQLGLANFLYSDADALFAHANRRKQNDGTFRPPGLHWIHRKCNAEFPGEPLTGLQIETAGRQDVILVASVPLTSEAWTPFREGEMLTIQSGHIMP